MQNSPYKAYSLDSLLSIGILVRVSCSLRNFGGDGCIPTLKTAQRVIVPPMLADSELRIYVHVLYIQYNFVARSHRCVSA